MLVVETVGRIRREHLVKGKPIREIARDLKLSRNTVRKVLRSGATSFEYARSVQPRPKLGLWHGDLDRMLLDNEKRPSRERLTLIRVFEELRQLGYEGSYDAVRRYARKWRVERGAATAEAYVPLSFAPGEAYQFDWSHEVVLIGGTTVTVKVAHVRLCHSRMLFVRAYPRETQEMVFDAHERAFRLFGGACRRGIYDNMTTAVEAVFVGKERRFNRRFLAMCSHYLVEPVACTPAAGWEKGQVENQVGNAREHLFTPRLHFADYGELNAWLEARCLTQARASAHPEQTDKTVWEVFEAERASLIAYRGPFDGFREIEVAVSKSSLVRYDHNRYSVAVKAARRTAQMRVYAERIVVWCDGEIVAEHSRRFGRGQTAYDPWHYLPVLARKPGALRNGDPFRNWDLPPALAQTRRRLAGHDDGDRQFVDILTAVAEGGLDAVEAACAEALSAKLFSRDVVLNILARQRDAAPAQPVATPAALTLAIEPAADCTRYDRLRLPPPHEKACRGAA